MPKRKTHKGLMKRITVGAHGTVRHKLAGGSHLMSTKSAKRRRKIRRGGLARGKDAARIRRALGIG